MKNFDAFLPNSEQNPAEYGVYPRSVHRAGDAVVYMAKDGGQAYLIAMGTRAFEGEPFQNAAGDLGVKAPLNHKNAQALRKMFPFTAPASVLTSARTVGVGDRLGIAGPGHIRVFEKYDAMPVLAQQSIRELTLTSRTYEDVLDCASFAVFREDFQKGFGADGDHLKTPKEVDYALSCGYSMITLDCSEHIRNDIGAMTNEEVDALYERDEALEQTYMNQCFLLEEGVALTFPENEFKRMVLIYGKAIDFAAHIYNTQIKGKAVDFEISIDETATPTTPAQHYFVVKELMERGVHFASVAPRFCGEFQKGVDYIGDLEQFRREFFEHAAIAKRFKYKISVHSGSDKFLVFPTIGEMTNGRFHVKTAGTNWLEAMRLVAMKDPALYREVHAFALASFAEAKKYYHVTTNLANIPDIAAMHDHELPGLFQMNDARQLIHITYGLILDQKAAGGDYLFRNRLYSLWATYEEEYADLLEAHIGKHLQLLYSGFSHAHEE